MNERIVLLSLDGISWEQCTRIAQESAALDTLLNHATVCDLSTTPFSTTQPIWSELLTGAPWYLNGCAGYCRPEGSLTHLEVVNERALFAPVSLLGNKSTSLAVNVPVLEPRNRSWLADGSLPTMLVAHPANLSSYFPNGYRPRPYASLADALSEKRKAAVKFLQSEEERLTALTQLLAKTEWKEAIIRINVFDQLQHLYGLESFFDRELLIYPAVNRFFEMLNQFLSYLWTTNSAVVLLSAYEHSRCRSRFNINSLLKKYGYLAAETVGKNQLAQARTEAVAMITGAPPSNASLASAAVNIAVKQTVAASPVGGCIYLNRCNDFRDGTVTAADEPFVISELRQFLQDRLSYYFGDRAVLVERPEGLEKSPAPIPQFIIDVKAVEFFDGAASIVDNSNRPSVCHSSGGFLAFQGTGKTKSTAVTTLEANSVLRSLGFGSSD